MKKFFIKNTVVKLFAELDALLSISHKKKAIVVLFLTLLTSVVDVLGLAAILPVISVVLNPKIIHTNPYCLGLYNFLGCKTDTFFSVFLLLLIVLVLVMKNLLGIFSTYFQSKFSFTIAADVAELQFKRYYSRGLEFFLNNNTPQLVSNIRSASIWLSSFILMSIINIISELIVVIVIVIGMAVYDSQLFVLVICTLVPAFLLVYRFIKNKVQKSEEEKAFFDVEVSKNLYQSLNGYIDVKLFNKDAFFIKRYLKFQKGFNTTQSKILTLQSIPAKVIELTAFSGVVMIVIYALYMKSTTNLLPLLTLYLVAAYRLMPSLNRILIAMVTLKSYSFVFDILSGVNEECKIQQSQRLEQIPFHKSINIENIYFKYPESDKYILNNFSLEIKKGERIGIIGQSGSGKTTFINLMLRFLTESSGKIVVDSAVDLNADTTNSWRELIGYVKQNVFIVEGDFYDNIAFGCHREEVDENKMQKVIQSARLTDVIDKLPAGLQTNIGENGTKLSGGQRQRVAIARALYKDAQILIFDEATSALDNETEKEITEAIDALSTENKTMVIIAHRISTLKNCTRIIELSDGVIIKECTYQDLLAVKEVSA